MIAVSTGIEWVYIKVTRSFG